MAKRVLLVNKFYYARGGDCVVVLNTEALLRENGVEAQVFAMEYPQNKPAHYQDLFASRVNFGGGIRSQWSALKRTLGRGDVVERFEAVLDDFKPDVVHLHNIHSYLSPIVGELAHQRGIRVVWTLHDYKLLCPRYDCLLNGKPCEKCFKGAKINTLTHKCMKGSLPASGVAWLEAKKWNRKRLELNTDVFVCPSEFMASKMLAGGFDPAKVKVLNNSLDPVKLRQYQDIDSDIPHDDYYCFVGRLSPEKGIEDLLEVAAYLPYKLKVAGSGTLEPAMRIKYADCSNIEFLGILDAVEVAHLLARARFSVMPSQCYDNNPLSVVESLCAGTPVAGSQMGGIPELIDSSNGIVFQPFDKETLSIAITMAMTREWNHSEIAAKALERFSPEAHMQALINDIYQL
ncbi:MAG: glycosyltransferase [Muribaculaceae bacterium]|nr:glycosyltransferase [Muribaculaceae bacterium]